MKRRAFLIGAASAIAGPALADAPATSLRPRSRSAELLRELQPGPAALIEKARLHGRVGCAVADVASGEILESVDQALAFPPASVAKAITAAYALDRLGPGYRFRTRLLATGPVRGGTLEGDLILAGGGDPTLDTDGLAELAARLKALGVQKVTGALRVWAGYLPTLRGIDPLQPDHVGYNPALSGLNLNYNRVHFGWRRGGDGYDVTMEARSARHRPAIRMARMTVERRSMPVYTYADREGRDDWTVARGALGQEGARWLPVRKPALYAGEVFQTLAKAQGIVLDAPRIDAAAPPSGAFQIATLESAPLRVILRDMLEYSTNLTAEIVGLVSTRTARGVAPASLAESAAAMNAWAQDRFGLESIALVDHSGLGDDSRISPRDMVAALRALRRSKGIKALLKPYSLKDADGRPDPDHPVEVRAKTGTLNFVSGLAGFIDLPDGRELVFAIFSADLELRDSLTKAERERPEGGRAWLYRARGLQRDLIERWGLVYAA